MADDSAVVHSQAKRIATASSIEMGSHHTVDGVDSNSNDSSKVSETPKLRSEAADIIEFLHAQVKLTEEALLEESVCDGSLDGRSRRNNFEKIHMNAMSAELKNVKAFVEQQRRAVERIDDLARNPPVGRAGSFFWGFVVFFVMSLRLIVGVSIPVRYDASTVDCWNINELSGVVVSLSLVWFAVAIADKKFLVVAYPATHLVMGPARRKKALGNTIKCVGRLAVLLFLSCLWYRFDFALGLDLGDTSCDSPGDAIARKIYFGSKALLLSVMVWECSAATKLSVDIWVHHLVLIYAVTLTTDENLRIGGDDPATIRANEGFGFCIMYGAAFNCLKEFFIGRFQHCMLDDRAGQFRALRMAFVAHVFNQTAFYIALPIAHIAVAGFVEGNMGSTQIALYATALVFLNALELYILRITLLVARKRQRQSKIPSFWA